MPCSFIAKAFSSGGSNCNNSGSIEIDAYPLPSPQVSYPPFSYSLDGVNYFPTNTTDVSTAVEDSLAPGLYKIYFKDSISQKQLFSVVIPKYCEVQITYVGVDASCKQSDGRITITATNGTAPYTYTMEGSNFQSSNTFSNLAAGTYNFSVKDAKGIITTSGATIYNKCPVIFVTGTDEICEQSNGTISATACKGTRPYYFSVDGLNFQSDSSFKNLTAGF